MQKNFYKALMLTLAFALGTIAKPSLGKEPFDEALFAKPNVIAWCIVPFDSQKRGPAQRAEMLNKLAIQHLAYDYRQEHVPTFDEEIEQLKQHGIQLTAWWFPTSLNEEAKHILTTLKKHEVQTQLWVMGGGDIALSGEAEEAFLASEVERIRTIAIAAAEANCTVGLYNHGGWFGDPRNQVKIIQRLKLSNVGIVYNLHHAHDQLDDLEKILEEIKPYLYAINLNGMKTHGDRAGAKILPIGEGDQDLRVIRLIGESGYRGKIGILNHTDEDALLRLQDNLEGLAWVVANIQGRETPKPTWKSFSSN